MPTNIVAGNRLLQDVATFLKNTLNAGHSLLLYSNFFIPTPGTAFLQFAEASFPGYARWNLNGVFGDPLKVADGMYAIRSVEHSWTCLVHTPVIIYGWFIIRAGNLVVASGAFDSGFPMDMSTLTIKLTVQDIALSILGL